MTNLKQIDRLTVAMEWGLTSTAFHFIPVHGNGKLLIYHGGHDGDFIIAKDLISLFLFTDLTWANFYYPSHLRIDSLCGGVLLGYLYQYKRDLFMKIGRFWPAFLAAVPILKLAYVFPVERSAFSYTVGFTIFYLLFGGLVVAARIHPNFGSSGPQRLLAWMGIYSYTIYLAHSVVYELPGSSSARLLVISQFGSAGDRLLFLAASVLLGVVISHLIERPFLRLRAKWLPLSPQSSAPPKDDPHVVLVDPFPAGSLSQLSR